MDTIKYQGVTYTRQDISDKLEHAENIQFGLSIGELSPTEIVGKGYLKPKRVAEQYTAEQVARWQTIIHIMREN